MKAYIATYADTREMKPNVSQSAPTLTVGANSLRGAAVKAEEHENADDRGELICLERTDKVIL